MLRLLPGQYALPNLGAHITSHADVAVSDGLALTYETPDGFHQRLGLRFQLRVLKLPVGIRRRGDRRLRGGGHGQESQNEQREIFHWASRNFASSIGTCRSDERRVGKECVSTWRSRWSPYC